VFINGFLMFNLGVVVVCSSSTVYFSRFSLPCIDVRSLCLLAYGCEIAFFSMIVFPVFGCGFVSCIGWL
jgi:hypothetical protein